LARLVSLAGPASAAAADAPPGASSCSGCHAARAAVQTPVPRLVGRPAAEIVTAMQAFRMGQRQATVMDRIAKGFSVSEIAVIAAWYAARKD
jgi:cytochrome c553